MDAMDMELAEDEKLPTMAEALAKFDQTDGPPKKVQHVGIPPQDLPSAYVVPQSKPREDIFAELPSADIIKEKGVPPAKTLEAALKPFIPFAQAEKNVPGIKSPSPRLIKFNAYLCTKFQTK